MGSAVETAAAVEIDKGGLRRYSLDDFPNVLGKAYAQNASAFPQFPQRRRREPSPLKQDRGRFLSAEADLDGGYGNPQKTRIPTRCLEKPRKNGSAFPHFPQARRLEQPKNQMHLNTYKGWTRHQEKAAKPPSNGADGVV